MIQSRFRRAIGLSIVFTCLSFVQSGWAMPDCPGWYNGAATAAAAVESGVARQEPGAAIAELEPVEQAIAYLTSLQDHGDLGVADLQTMLIAIETTGALSNPFAGQTSRLAAIHGESLQLLLAHADPDRVKEWLRAQLRESQRVQQEQSEVQVETRYPWRRPEFHPIPAGEFDMGEEGKKVHVKLTHDVEVMTTLVTQWMWVREMGANPSRFANGDHSVTVQVPHRSIILQPENPVENMTWWSAAEFANRYSIKMGLPPVYDFSQIEFDPATSAEAGTWKPLSREEGQKLSIIAPGEDIYQAQGYRLPTDAEVEYWLRNLGKADGKYPHNLSQAELGEVAWHLEYSGEMTHPVGSTPRSLMLNDKEFPDLTGNVGLWCHDFFEAKLRGGVNPLGHRRDYGTALRFGGWNDYPEYLLASSRGSQSADCRKDEVGIRLVRTLR